MTTSHPQHPPGVAHHFDDAQQQHEAANLGMWTFLVTEIMFFGAMFTGFLVYRNAHTQGFAEASGHLDVWMGTINTAVLLCSSLSMAMAVHAAQLRHRRALVSLLLLTIALGAVFLVIKSSEYNHKFHEHLVPGASFAFPGDEPRAAEMFFVFYFIMTAIHATHMVAGIAVMIGLTIMAWRNRFEHNPNLVEMTGLYWHFVDIVWIFLFPLLYLSFH